MRTPRATFRWRCDSRHPLHSKCRGVGEVSTPAPCDQRCLDGAWHRSAAARPIHHHATLAHRKGLAVQKQAAGRKGRSRRCTSHSSGSGLCPCRRSPGSGCACDAIAWDAVWVTRACLDKQPHNVAAMFDQLADRYDLTNGVLSFGQDRRWRRAVLSAVDPSRRSCPRPRGRDRDQQHPVRAGGRERGAVRLLGRDARGRKRLGLGCPSWPVTRPAGRSWPGRTSTWPSRSRPGPTSRAWPPRSAAPAGGRWSGCNLTGGIVALHRAIRPA